MSRPPARIGLVWQHGACPACGRDWWIGVDQLASSFPVADVLAADGLSEMGREAADQMRALLGVCEHCREGSS